MVPIGRSIMLISIFGFLGGLALFLYGMELMGDGLRQSAGARLQKILESLTSVPALGVLTGLAITAILQSSSATTVMSVSLVNAGLMTLKQAFSVVMGANIGTTVTAQLIAFNVTDYMTGFLFVGLLLHYFSKHKTGKFAGMILMGFGLLMLGMKMMGQSVAPLRGNPVFVHFIGQFSDVPLLGVGVGILMTLIIQSSSATIGILMAMASQGLVPLEGAVPVLLGDNVGTCITAVLAATRASRTARQVALSHVCFNLFGCLIFLLFLPWFLEFVRYISPAHDIGRQIANAHSSFNILNTCLFLPLITPYVKFIQRLLPDKADRSVTRPLFLDDAMLENTPIALMLAEKETDRLARQSEKNLAAALDSLRRYSPKRVDYVQRNEETVDHLNNDITLYLTKISETGMTPELSAKHTALMHACTDMERIGDHAQTLAKRSRKIFEEQVEMSPEAKQEIVRLSILTLEACHVCLRSFIMNDPSLAQQGWTLCRHVKSFQKECRKNHIRRLNEGTCSPEVGMVFLELLINLKRVSDHSKNIAQLVLGIF
jgi:phosphate:Na+ symporter